MKTEELQFAKISNHKTVVMYNSEVRTIPKQYLDPKDPLKMEYMVIKLLDKVEELEKSKSKLQKIKEIITHPRFEYYYVLIYRIKKVLNED